MSFRLVVGARTYSSLATYIPDASSVEHRDLVAELSRRFGVSQQAARIRLVTLGLECGATRSMLSRATG